MVLSTQATHTHRNINLDSWDIYQSTNCVQQLSLFGEERYRQQLDHKAQMGQTNSNKWARDEKLEHQGIPGQKIRPCQRESLKREEEERNLLHIHKLGMVSKNTKHAGFERPPRHSSLSKCACSKRRKIRLHR